MTNTPVWLLKSEPSTYSWSDLVRDKQTRWDGIRNYTARNNLNAMKVGDHAFFYHSGDDKAVVGVVQVVRTAYPDPGVKPNSPDAKKSWVCVDIAAVSPAAHALTLAEIKADAALKKMEFVRQSRLSVSPVTSAEAKRLLKHIL